MKNIMSTAVGLVRKASFFAGLSFVTVTAFAADDNSLSSLTALQTNLTGTAGTIYKIAMIVATLAGLLLIIKGLVHLKQNYTGSSQEKHLSKGIASLVFGAALILAVPISHMFVGTLDANASFDTGAGAISFS